MTLLAVLLALAAPQAQSIDDVQSPKIDAAFQSITAGRPQEALDALAPVIVAYEADQAKEKRHLYCGMSVAETIAYMALPDPDKKGAVALAPGYCTALYLKGFALIDLNRIADARAVYLRVVSLAPFHAHFLSELGQSYRYDKNWPMMLDSCKRAEGVVGFASDESRKKETALAWHCQGYALTELGKLDEAEKLYRQCLELDPDDAHAKNELLYIAERRKKTT
ncbi:tetratricopeptide repeat protein [Sphingomonas sp.]|jgi:tetratricopeptide (TPR) repeat protein|uniref:tetratricopeptide repeat protein n=1 Tax=Sphingomonas sp. TaxID=28214 RepID=UPI002E2F84BB|nr:tetratricopeptide repeat protein [Sphingomonas sp.]HEX4693705.1 tetratricopeptide repeat protein [Sphingomonas sp.]